MTGMKRLLSLGLVAVIGVTKAWAATGATPADENFSTAVRPADFSAAGLGKLSA